MKIEIPDKVEYILNRLLENGFEAYAVGGCVRDALLNRVPGDWDITTSAKPEQVKSLFKRTIDTGIQHGTVTVMLDKEGFEVTTYRIDGEYTDSRHPKSVEFTLNLVEDLKRRDFTINAMAYNHVTGIVDEFGGMEDLQRKRIVCVGNPKERFEEDALRMLRAIRFSGQLDFEIEEGTKNAIRELASTISNISAERIRVEMEKLLCSKNPEKFLLAYETGLANYFLPEFVTMMETEQENPNHKACVGEHCIQALCAFCNEIVPSNQYQEQQISAKDYACICWALLLHDVGKPEKKTMGEDGYAHFYGHDKRGAEIAEKILKRLKCDNYTIDNVIHFIRWHDYRYELKNKAIRKALNKVGRESIYKLLFIQTADVLAQSMYKREEKIMRLEKAKEIVDRILENNEAITLKDLKVNGKDLMEAGIKPGKEMGTILNNLLELVLDNPENNEKDFLLNYAKTLKN